MCGNPLWTIRYYTGAGMPGQHPCIDSSSDPRYRQTSRDESPRQRAVKGHELIVTNWLAIGSVSEPLISEIIETIPEGLHGPIAKHELGDSRVPGLKPI